MDDDGPLVDITRMLYDLKLIIPFCTVLSTFLKYVVVHGCVCMSLLPALPRESIEQLGREVQDDTLD
jgi:hypothetical protein